MRALPALTQLGRAASSSGGAAARRSFAPAVRASATAAASSLSRPHANGPECRATANSVVGDAKREFASGVGKVSGLKEMSGGEVVFNMLVERDVECVFGYSGGAVLPLIDAFHGKSITFYSSSHEQCSGHSAAGYAKATGKVGVVVVTSGPGITNLVTPLQDAYTDGVPVIVFSGQVPTSAMGSDAFQECPATEITRPCTKWNYVCLDFNQLPWAINEAFRIAVSGRPGPCHIDLPKDIVSMRAQVPAAIFRRSNAAAFDAPPMIDMQAVRKACELMNKAERPILYVGQGASHCPDILRKVAEKAQIPVTTTVHGMGIFDERDPLSLHMLGMHGAAYANFAIQQADLIIAVGSRFDDRTTGIVDKYAPKAKAAAIAGTGGIIHINIDKNCFGKVVDPTVKIWADCEHALEAMEDHIEESNGERKEWLQQCQEWKKTHAFDYVRAPEGKIKVQQVIEAMNKFLHDKKIVEDRDVTICTGVGNHQMMAAQFVRWTRPRSMITSGSLGVMGAGLPYAIGAQVALPESMTILIDGDGSFNMTHIDLQTVKRYNLPIKIAIMNDARQQMVWIWQKLFFDGRYISVDNHNPDFLLLAKAHGIECMECSKEEDLPGVIEKWLTHDGPMLIDFKVVPDICLPMVAPGKALDEMILLQDREFVFGSSDEELGQMKFEGLAPS
mmetsp:Transcript_168318/g.298217  ORF Transcript_168318/g.298217 Transcript_168318/m.298217 type:complete len:674 (+) Transcript_168318:150-2171(+)